MNTPRLLMLLVGITLVGAMAGLSAGQRRFGLPAECARKLLHVAMGLVTLSFPWLFSSPWPVLALALAALAWLAAIRRGKALRRCFGPVLEGVGRPGWGEGYFVLGAAATFLLAQDSPLFYCLPMAILSFADAGAALIGQRWGRQPGAVRFGGKSLAGSSAFFAIALGCGVVALQAWEGWAPSRSWPHALLLALVTTVLEAMARCGLDNLLIPLGALMLLRLEAEATPAALLLHLGVGLALIAGYGGWRYRTACRGPALFSEATRKAAPAGPVRHGEPLLGEERS